MEVSTLASVVSYMQAKLGLSWYSLLATASTAVALGLSYRYYIFPRYISSLKSIRGPPGGSFFSGHMRQILEAEAGSAQLGWVEKYGQVYKYLDFLGNTELYIADPKALSHVLVHKTYDYPKPEGLRDMAARILGQGIVFVEGDQHKRQRKVLNPAFAQKQVNEYLPVFQEVANKLVSKFQDMIDTENGKRSEKYTVINVHKWLSRATLDIIGLAGFDYNFGGLDEEENDLANAFSGVLTASRRTPMDVFILYGMRYIPFIDKLPIARANKMKASIAVMQREGKKMIALRKEQAAAGELEGKKDLLSLIVKANMQATNPKDRLADDEVMGQITTFTVAGHETSANALTWLLHYMALYPEVQQKLRDEIHQVEKEMEERGESALTLDDLSKMRYLDAVLKETLRLAPPLYYTNRQAAKDDVIPLAKPIKVSNGSLITSIPVKKGQDLIIGIYASNKSKEIFGETADQFIPERWLIDDKSGNRSEQAVNFVTWSPLLTFLAGNRGCIGYRLALMEMKVLTLALLSKFEFLERDPDGTPVSRNLNSVIRPVVIGEEDRGTQLPLRVRKVGRN